MNKTGIILAGGRSSRFGTNKAICYFQGKTMLKHSVDLLKSFCDKILISGDKEEYYIYDYPCIPDKYGEVGPLGGIASCLEVSENEMNIVVPCDMPLITEDLIAKLLLNHQAGKITVFRDKNKRIYPFPFIVEKGHFSAITHLLNNNQRCIQELFQEEQYTPVLLADADIPSLANVNSKDDLIKIGAQYQ